MSTSNYEAMAILDPLMPEPELNAIVDRLGEIITANGGNLLETARWGRRKLAFEIGRRSEGYYVIYYFTMESGAAITQFERSCRYDEHVLRAMVVKVPTKKRGQEVAQLVPAPGYLADFRIEPRAHSYRRRWDREAPAGAEARSETADAPTDAAASEAPAETAPGATPSAETGESAEH